MSELLGTFDWLRELPVDQRRRVQSSAVQSSYARGQTVYGPEAHPDRVYLLERGLVRIIRVSRAGNEIHLGFVKPGEIFGELELFCELGRDSYAEAVGDASAWSIPRHPFLEAVESSPPALLAISRQMARRFKKTEDRVEDLAFRTTRGRLARMLLELAQEFAPKSGGEGISLRLTQRDLAMLIGSRRQTVNECLSHFRDTGAVAYRGSRITGIDRDRVTRFADEER